MKSDDESLPTRKAFSAENSKDVNEFQSTPDTPKEINNRTFKSCASASHLSTRRKYIQERQFQNLLSEEFSLKYLKLDSKEDEKVFLSASQILEKLNKIISRSSATFQLEENSNISSANPKKASLREIVLYQEVLKRLLEERCTLMLKEECDVCIKRTLKLINDFKHLYMNEKLKLMTMPIQACSRFVSSSDISVSTLELLIKKLQIICDLHSSISSSYQKIINCFHVGLDLELYQMVLKTNLILREHKSNLFYWAYKSMTTLMQKLCLADPNSVSPDFLQSILESCEVFNSLLKSNKGLSRHHCIQSCDLFYSHIKNFECKELSFSLVLNYLAFFEAKIASEKIVSVLTSTCKKFQQADLKKKIIQSNNRVQNIDSNTSDYCSISVSDLDSESSAAKIHQFSNISMNFSSVLISVTQRNQSLILKYLYAISNLQNSSSKKARRASCDGSSSILPVRQMWNVPQQNVKNDSHTFLEETYWTEFWNNVQMFVLKILLEVPYHRYGDSVAGTIILWPDSLLQTLFECLKLSSENNDITAEGKYVMKQIYEYILIHRIHLLWDKEFSSALTAAQSHLCTPVPTALNQIKTQPGNVLFSCLDLVLDIFNEDFQDMDTLLFLQCLNQVLSTLDCFILWLNSKTRALIASRNLPTYLLISWSDCMSASNLLESKIEFLTENPNTFTRIPVVKLQTEKMILKQINVLKGYNTEAPDLIYKICFSTIKNSLLFALKYEHSSRHCSLCGPKTFTTDIQEELIFPLTEVINHLSDVSPLLMTISTSLTQAFISILHNLKNTLRTEQIQFLSVEHSKFIRWIEKLNLPEEKKIELKHLHCMQKLEGILKYIQSSASHPKTFFKQQNRIMPLDETATTVNENILSEQEKRYWVTVGSRSGRFSICF